jgi:nicotinamidase-related amidase
MALTQIDPVAALVVIDMQKGIVGLDTAHPAHEIAARIGQLARAFREQNLPVVLVNVTGGAPGRTEVKRSLSRPPDWSELAPELDRQPKDHTVTKVNIGAFYGTALDLILRRNHTTQVVLAGISTSMGVESTARSAYDQGYNVVLVVDAMTDSVAENHRHSVERIFPRLGETTTTAEVLDLLGRR